MSYHIATRPLLRAVLIFLTVWAFFAGIYYAKPFLTPLVFAGLFAMLLWPVCRTLEGWGLNDKLAAFLAVLLFVGVFVGVGFLLSNQIKSFMGELPKLQESFENRLEDAKIFIEDKFGISEERQEKALTEQGRRRGRQLGQQAAFYFVNALGKFLIMLVYLFLLLIYRARFKNFIIQYTPEARREQARQVIVRSAHVAKDYLSGRLLLMVILAIMYVTGLSIIGIEQAIFFGVLAAILGIIPFVGNILGAILPISVALINEGTTAAIAVVALFTVVQLIENYLLEPLVVGKKVDLNAFFAIAIVILGEMLWGISGAILAMPVLGIAKIIFDNIKQLEPLGYLIGEDHPGEDSDRGSKLAQKIKDLFTTKS
jgi:predicted PurR-regulated permease PerM